MKDQADFPDLEKFTERLRQTRKAVRLNQTDFGALGGVGLGSQSRYEKGETEPSAGYFVGLAAHDVDVAYLFTGRRSADSLSDSMSRLVATASRLTERQQSALHAFLATFDESTDPDE